ncbi:hypothetical protein TNCV_5053381 [Trichonephila clavipes]|nr:hypothetical protein TNCV_5053381 [Trichonephila clavipes]
MPPHSLHISRNPSLGLKASTYFTCIFFQRCETSVAPGDEPELYKKYAGSEFETMKILLPQPKEVLGLAVDERAKLKSSSPALFFCVIFTIIFNPFPSAVSLHRTFYYFILEFFVLFRLTHHYWLERKRGRPRGNCGTNGIVMTRGCCTPKQKRTIF